MREIIEYKGNIDLCSSSESGSSHAILPISILLQLDITGTCIILIRSNLTTKAEFWKPCQTSSLEHSSRCGFCDGCLHISQSYCYYLCTYCIPLEPTLSCEITTHTIEHQKLPTLIIDPLVQINACDDLLPFDHSPSIYIPSTIPFPPLPIPPMHPHFETTLQSQTPLQNSQKQQILAFLSSKTNPFLLTLGSTLNIPFLSNSKSVNHNQIRVSNIQPYPTPIHSPILSTSTHFHFDSTNNAVDVVSTRTQEKARRCWNESIVESLVEVIKFDMESSLEKLLIQYQSRGVCGVLVYGEFGVGKSFAVREACSRANVMMMELQGSNLALSLGRHRSGNAPMSSLSPDIELSQMYATLSSMNLRRVVLFIDDLDLIATSRSTMNVDSSSSLLSTDKSRFVAQLLTLMDSSEAKPGSPQVLFIATATHPELIDPALRRGGRFEFQIPLVFPAFHQRQLILQDLLEELIPDTKDDRSCILDALSKFGARCTSGFSLFDLQKTCRSLAINSETLSEVSFRQAAAACGSSLVRSSGFAVDYESTEWNEIIGYENQKQKLYESLLWPIMYRESWTRLKLRAARGILLYGPPGCSKTSMVRALLTCAQLPALSLSGADIYSCFLGEAERIVRDVFRTARAVSPCIIFIDELDALVGSRSVASSDGNGVQARVLGTLLNEMDGVRQLDGVVLVSATNRVDMIDDALLRPGRFDEIIHIPYPDETDRQLMLSRFLEHCDCSHLNMDALNSAMRGKSGAEIAALCRAAVASAHSQTPPTDHQKTSIYPTHFEAINV